MNKGRTRTSPLTTIIRIVGWWLVTAIIVLTFVPPSLRSITGVPHEFEHLVIFLLTGAAFGFGYPRRERILCIAALFFSAVLEISQLIIPGRHARFTDFLTDAFGACTGIIAASLLRSMRVQLTT